MDEPRQYGRVDLRAFRLRRCLARSPGAEGFQEGEEADRAAIRAGPDGAGERRQLGVRPRRGEFGFELQQLGPARQRLLVFELGFGFVQLLRLVLLRFGLFELVLLQLQLRRFELRRQFRVS